MLLQPVKQLVVRRDQCSLGRLTLCFVLHDPADLLAC